MHGFLRFSGSTLFLGGILAVVVNALLTPQLPTEGGTVAVATSTAFAIRMPLAAISVALTTLGCIGLYLAQAERLRFGAIAFALAGVGGLLAVCAECVQFTLIRDLAQNAPDTLLRLEEEGGLARYELGFAIALSTFMLGWIAVAVQTLLRGVLNRRGPVVLLVGLVLVPSLGAALGVIGAAVGNVVLGAGWALMGWDLRNLTR